MRSYTVHVPSDVAEPLRRADRTVFLREGFSKSAFVFGWLFLLVHQLWLAAALWIVAGALLAGIVLALHLPLGAALALFLLMHLFVGLEGNDLRRWRLNRQRFVMADVIAASARSDAERVFFGRQPVEVPHAAALPSRIVPRDTTPSVIGMFPDENG